MRIFQRFWKREAEKETVKPKETPTELETICGEDREAYQALYHTMLIYPWEIKVSMEEAAQKAKELETNNKSEAVNWYRIAGQLAIFGGDVGKVKAFFGKCQELSGREYPIVKIPERAVEKAQEYYRKFPKEEKKK